MNESISETAERVLPPTPWPIPYSNCTNCGHQLAWRRGVGRYCITHAHGSDKCCTTSVQIGPQDVKNAREVLTAMDDLLRNARQSQKGNDNG